MRLEKISIKNFKGLHECELEPGTFSCLVGENNAGKSSILQGITAALSRSGQIADGLFYDPDIPIEFHCTFSNVTEPHLRRLAPEHRTKIAEIISEEKLDLVVRYRRGEKCETLAYRNTPIDQRYRTDAITELLAGKKAPAVANAVRESLPELAEGLPDNATITAAKAHLAERISALPADQLERTIVPLPTGIPSSIGQLIPEPIYIPAVKNLTDDLKTAQSTTFGRLLGLLLEEMEPALNQVKQSLAQLNAMFNRILGDDGIVDDRHEKVVFLERLIQNNLRNNFPTVAVELSVPPPELREILNSAEIFIDDGSKDVVANKGDGLKRSLTFALLQAYVHQRDEIRARAKVVDNDDAEYPARRPMVFLFEEPELYLHPYSQKVLFKTLASISDEHQVVVTTHSPIFFAPGVTASFVRVAKIDREPKPVAKLYPVNFELDQGKADTFRLTRFENADAAFFSRRVVLFEGESDDAFCRHVALRLNPDWDFDAKSIAMVRVSGKGNFARFREFFQAFGLEVKVVADLDALFEGYDHLRAPAYLNEMRAGILAQIDQFIIENQIPAEPASRQIKDKVCGESWKQRYGRAKFILRQIQAGAALTPESIATFDALFTWEENVARVKACREHDAARAFLIPLLDALRAEGICVLSRGAIEEYYPDDAAFGPKPQRALVAIGALNTREDILALCEPVSVGRDCELIEVFQELFRDA